ncbi:hypothetical protein [Streptomyces sp. NPDC058240]|uniref:hypothetical protein n=1 Tax=Streptomyces sp. NPDC058240 TaxID=3346396 RepID=UPI0036E5A8B1
MDQSDVVRVTATVASVTQQFGVRWDEVPRAWKTLTLRRFDPGIPSLIRDLPEDSNWYEQPQDPARNRDRDLVGGELSHERVEPFPGRFACDR